jgi:phenylalanyl-tRNA synthetase beta chain
MRTSVRWINDYLDRPADAEEQANALTAAGFNFDGREELEDGGIQQEIETTSNRGDCLCHLELARELAAATGRTVKVPVARPAAKGPAIATLTKVSNTDHEACPRYTARVIRGVKVGPSPAWMQQRLREAGQVPRNNLVDCTNFVLLEMGQPTHVFDLKKLRGAEIRVRLAGAGEPFLPLGEHAQPIKLTAQDLVIADAERPVALAGVKGGAETAVDESTVDVLLEAATFSPTMVRHSSRRHQIFSDSGKRFERGVHPASIDAAADRLAALILETAGGELATGTLEAGAPMPAPRTVRMRPSRCQALLGIPLAEPDMTKALAALGFAPAKRGDAIECTVPAQRMDIDREVDLIEEVIRLLGTDRIPVGDTLRIRTASPDLRMIALERTKDLLSGLGFVECVTHALVTEKLAQAFLPKGDNALRIEDERAGGTPCLRPAAVTGPVAARALNADRGARTDVRLFEIAHAFRLGSDGNHREWQALGLVADAPDASAGYRTIRGVVERLAHELAGAAVTMEPTTGGSGIEPAATVSLHGKPIGRIGLLSASAAAAVGLDLPLAVAEIELESLVSRFPPERPAAALPAFPGAERDVSVVVAEATPWSQIEATVRHAKPEHLESLSFVTTYRGKQLGAGRKSVTLRLVFRRADGTLRREDVDAIVAKLTESLQKSLGAELRA